MFIRLSSARWLVLARRAGPLLLLLGVFYSLLAPRAIAQTDYSWDGASDAFANAAHWSPSGGPPTNADRALFQSGSFFTVSGTGGPLQAVVDTSDVTFSGPLSPTGSTSSPAFIVGQSSFGSATLDGNGASLVAGSAIQIGTGSTGELTFSGGATGSSQGAAGVAAANVGISSNGSGTLTVTGAGSMFASNGSFDLAVDGTGVVHVEDGGRLETNGNLALGQAGLNIALNSASTATINISGEATLHNELQTNLGLGGTGVLNVSSGVFTTTDGGTANPALSIGRFATGDGELNVTGTGLAVTEGEIIVGGDGAGRLNISDAGQVQSNVTVGAPAIVGFGASASGSVAVDGIDADWRVTDALVVGQTGSGDVNLDDGGTLFIEDTAAGGDPYLFIGEADGSFGSISVADEFSFLDASFVPVTLGVNDGSSGSLELADKGRAFIQRTVVGSAGFGSIFAEIDSRLTTGTVILGEQPTGDGTIDLAEQATMEVLGQLIIGSQGSGAMEVFDSSLTVLEFISIGDQAGSFGSLVVDGQSSIAPQSGSGTLTSLTVGNLGRGGLTVTGTTTIDINGPTQFGVGADSQALVTFFQDTALSTTGTLTVGDQGTADFTTSAVIQSGTAFIAKSGAFSSASINAGSWTINNSGPDNGSMFVGGSDTAEGGVGTLIVGGELNVNNRLKVWGEGRTVLLLGTVNAVSVEVFGRLEGSGNINAASTHITGAVAPSRFSFATAKLVFSGDFTQLAGSTLEIQLGGLVPETEFDVIQLAGTALLNGGLLHVSLVDLGAGLFAPSLGDEFAILTTGTFDPTDGQYDPADISLPALAGGLGWDVVYSGAELTLRVVSEAPLAGDYNNDGMVDAIDYAVWRENLGTNAVLPNDTVGGTIGTGQYNTWRNNFGAVAPGHSATATPEPAAVCFCAAALIVMLAAFCRRDARRLRCV